MAVNKKKAGLSNHEAYSQNGSINQAGRDIIINHAQVPTPSPKLRGIPRWQAIVAICTGLAGLLTFAFELPHKMGLKSNAIISTPDSIFVTGIIKSFDSGKGIAKAWVTFDINPGDTIYTTSDGTFQKFIKGKTGDDVRVYAGAKGYENRNEYATIPRVIELNLERSDSKVGK